MSAKSANKRRCPCCNLLRYLEPQTGVCVSCGTRDDNRMPASAPDTAQETRYRDPRAWWPYYQAPPPWASPAAYYGHQAQTAMVERDYWMTRALAAEAAMYEVQEEAALLRNALERRTRGEMWQEELL